MKYLLLLPLLGLLIFNSCKKDPEYESFYLKYTIDGEEYEYIGNEISHTPFFTTGHGQAGHPLNDTISFEFHTNFQSSLGDGDEYSIFSIKFERITTKQIIDSIIEKDLGYYYLLETIRPNIYSFFAHRVSEKSIQVNISYNDNDNGIGYLTDGSSFYYNNRIDDERFHFEVLENKEYIDDYGKKHQLVTSKFDCVLYNQNGDSVTLTDGQMKSLYAKYD